MFNKKTSNKNQKTNQHNNQKTNQHNNQKTNQKKAQQANFDEDGFDLEQISEKEIQELKITNLVNQEKKKTKTVAIVGGVIILILLLVVGITSSKLHKLNKSATAVDQSKVVIEDHQDFKKALESSKDAMIGLLNDKIKNIENLNQNAGTNSGTNSKTDKPDTNSPEYKAKNSLLVNYKKANAEQADIAKNIISEICSIDSSIEDKDLEIKRQRVSKYFKDELSKQTYDLVNGTSPAKKINENTALVGVPIVTMITTNDDYTETMIYACIVSNNKQYTAIYKANWKSDNKLDDFQFIGLMDEFKL